MRLSFRNIKGGSKIARIRQVVGFLCEVDTTEHIVALAGESADKFKYNPRELRYTEQEWVDLIGTQVGAVISDDEMKSLKSCTRVKLAGYTWKRVSGKDVKPCG